jgi:D-xylose transport system substrate-binding protein
MSLGSACTNESTSSAADSKIKIGFLLKTMQEERYQKDKAFFIAKAEALGADVVFDSANNDEQMQLAKFENMMAEGCRVIVLQPVNTGTAGNMVRMANREGIKVVGYDSMLVNGPLDMMVMQDSWAVGRLQAQAMIKWLRQKKGAVTGNVVLIKGQPGDSNAIAMSSGAVALVEQYPGLKLVAEQWHEAWSPDKAMATAENVLTKHKNNIDAFICNNSGMARGVVAALDAVGLADTDKVFVAGSDADLINIQYVARGKQSVEVWKKIRPLAERAAEAAVMMAKGESVAVDERIHNGFTEVPTIVTPVVLVDRGNVEHTVVAGGFVTREQIFGG